MALIKRDKRDELFSLLIRERSGWTCEACGKYYPEGHRRGLHCSHIFSRRHKRTRWSPNNAVAHCYACHQRLGGNPIEFTAWAENYLGEGLLQIVREQAHSICKLTKADLEDIHKHLKAEHKRMLALRAQGEAGRIEFADPM